jgi:CubicO group peptidase (beta-lactamase class C family)
MQPFIKRLTLLTVICCTSHIAFTQTWQDTAAKIEKLFVRYKADHPGAQLAISRNGNVIYSKAWGMADLEHNISLTTVSPTEAGSVSKQFTAAAILILEQQGKLKLEDDVRNIFLSCRIRQLWGACVSFLFFSVDEETLEENQEIKEAAV